ncbi:MAG: hypothetical protein ACOCVY_01290 [Patescibacteria group bacterium]
MRKVLIFLVLVLLAGVSIGEAQDVRKVYVHFAEGSAEIENFSEVTRVAEFIGSNSEVEILAHTSETGDFEVNKRIADRRAKNIKDALLKVVPNVDVTTKISPYQVTGQKINATVGVVKILNPVTGEAVEDLSQKIESLSNKTSMGQREIEAAVKDLKDQVLDNRDLADKQRQELLQELDNKIQALNLDLSQEFKSELADALEPLQKGQQDIRSGQNDIQESIGKGFDWLKLAIIGLAVGLLLVLAAILFLVFRSRKAEQQQPEAHADDQLMNFPKKPEDIADMFFNKKNGNVRAGCPYCGHTVTGRNYLTHLRKSCTHQNPLKGKTHEEAKQELSTFIG